MWIFVALIIILTISTIIGSESVGGLIFILIIGAIIVIFLYIQESDCSADLQKRLREKEDSFSKLQAEYQKLIESENERVQAEEKALKKQHLYDKLIVQKDSLYNQFLNENISSYPYLAECIADIMTLEYEYSAEFLETKQRPAITEAKKIRELKAETKEHIKKYKILEYQLGYLKSLFPAIEEVLETDAKDLSTEISITDYDKTKDYLSKEEWLSLSTSQKNQLALDRYVAGHKSKWQIGRDYELYIGYIYNRKGYDIDYFGSNNGLNDMGRDLICKKSGEILIVQCKYWSHMKEIHENHICQLYGTVVEYSIENNCAVSDVIPVLVTNISLSSTAKKFAEVLNIIIHENIDMGDFPRIKCNINRSDGYKTQIYHLPMDQQYDSVKISGPEEFFAFTVEEAEKAGFRRAFKHFQQ